MSGCLQNTCLSGHVCILDNTQSQQKMILTFHTLMQTRLVGQTILEDLLQNWKTIHKKSAAFLQIVFCLRHNPVVKHLCFSLQNLTLVFNLICKMHSHCKPCFFSHRTLHYYGKSEFLLKMPCKSGHKVGQIMKDNVQIVMNP